jgi:hypothetical protein
MNHNEPWQIIYLEAIGGSIDGADLPAIADADRVIVAMNDEATAQHIVNCVNAMRFFDPKTVAKAASQTDPQNALIELAHPEGYHVS